MGRVGFRLSCLVSCIWRIKTHSVPIRFIQIHLDLFRSIHSNLISLSLTQFRPIIIRSAFAQLYAVSHRFAQIHRISHSLIQIHLITLKHVQIHSAALKSTQIHSVLLQILPDSHRLLKIRSDSLKFAQTCSDKIQLTNPEGKREINALSPKGKRGGGRTLILSLIWHE